MQTSRTNIHISIRDQRLTLKEGGLPIGSYPVSTSRFGVGTEEGSMKTPTGRFRVAKKIGEGLPSDTVFTRDRFIYIHGTKHEDKIGIPDSHGCVRMRNTDVVELFALVDEGVPVIIEE